MRRDEIITTDARVMSGTPVFAGTRVPVDSLLAHLDAGDTLEDLLSGFPGVRREQGRGVSCIAKTGMRRYDADADSLTVFFVPGQSATGLELNENDLLRVDRAAGVAVGLTIFNFSVLAQPTEMGPRSVPLTGLAELSPDLREMALSILLRSPVAEYLKLSAYAPSSDPRELVPITVLEPVALSRAPRRPERERVLRVSVAFLGRLFANPVTRRW